MIRRSLRVCKKRTTEKNPETNHKKDALPLDLLLEILIRLPATSVTSFMLVSKAWANTIRSKDFLRSFPYPSSPCRLLIALQGRDRNTGRQSCCFFSSSSSLSSSTTSFLSRITNPSSSNRPGWLTAYYVNGLMSIGQVICNPITGKSITLPKLLKTACNPRLAMRFFGYDPANNQYKVLSLSPTPNSTPARVKAQVFTLGGAKPKPNSWRLIDCPIPHALRSRGLCIDGSVYYIAGGTGLMQMSLMRFDLNSEKFDIFASVSEAVRALRPRRPLNLINYHGKVAIAIQPIRTASRIDVRVFQAGKQDELEVSFHDLPQLHMHIKGVVSHTGEVVFASYGSPEAHVFHYDPNNSANKLTRINIQVDANRNMFSEANYFLGFQESYVVVS
ncbi:unnamed protein product [Microthlaspi erraticum]|uniref:F-box domain-containing protein n=1 Tax=Microthlaspi erraticum TaxID=1685480 RepID=A0A6D2IUF2_9BRAS|nr:unnamed protein product [Microthlaspi erraticum]